MQDKVIPVLVSNHTKEYEKSNENKCRSLKVLYENGLMAKEKYKSVCRNIKTNVDKSVANPKLIYYDKLIAFIKSEDVQNIHDFASEFCTAETLEFEEPVHGSFRDFCSYMIVLADLYISVDQALGPAASFFQHFGSLPFYHFRVAIGADGAPFGKDDEATAWLVSFINAGKHIQSENDNFLICGANYSESHKSMQKYAKKLMHDIAHIESTTYNIQGFQCRFTIELVPLDMKWLSSMSGELSNAFFYFSPFGNVNSDNKAVTNGSLGEDCSCTWQPWDYNGRIEKVAQERDKISQSKGTLANKRNKLLNFIKALGTRQEYKPLLGKLVDRAFAEPLHSNNAWAYFHGLILEIALAKSSITQSCTQIEDLPPQSLFRTYIRVLKDKLGAARLVKKTRLWFNEGRKSKFSYRFTGKESRIFCHKFMFLLQALYQAVDPPETKVRIATMLSAAYNITQEEVNKCKNACQLLFNANVLLLKSVTPTLWTVGYAIPRHLQILFDQYGMGLGLNNMQGREAKHVRLSQFAKHTTKSTRWSMVLRHDYMCNVWIRKHEPAHSLYTAHKQNYIPTDIEQETFCYYGYPVCESEHGCTICSSCIFQAVSNTATAGVLSTDMKQILGIK